MTKREAKKLGAWLDYLTGPTGYGIWKYSTKPEYPKLSPRQRRILKPMIAELQQYRKRAFSLAYQEVTGEELIP